MEDDHLGLNIKTKFEISGTSLEALSAAKTWQVGTWKSITFVDVTLEVAKLQNWGLCKH